MYESCSNLQASSDTWLVLESCQCQCEEPRRQRISVVKQRYILRFDFPDLVH